MSTGSKLVKRLAKSKEHRKAFVASQIKIGIPFQIRALRKKQSWSQQELADAADMLQPRISAMESPGYGSLTLDTLQRIAAAFDVGLVVRFAPFSELVGWSDTFSPDDFDVLNFDEELELFESTPAVALPEHKNGDADANFRALTEGQVQMIAVVESSGQTLQHALPVRALIKATGTTQQAYISPEHDTALRVTIGGATGATVASYYQLPKAA